MRAICYAGERKYFCCIVLTEEFLYFIKDGLSMMLVYHYKYEHMYHSSIGTISVCLKKASITPHLF